MAKAADEWALQQVDDVSDNAEVSCMEEEPSGEGIQEPLTDNKMPE